ncbi:hypothetical protein [Sporolactobacillus nakayamae]|uniref:Uncharacterized protein n=1 Tax=Sporolactobacillus nakayamae TaxID=269670 RepID=A0A1I2W2U2_9BACL|nr:hypothetical protein [Sporolactobacillus nakayamae]SFG95673.1 hypothetical protein SAMN02982927_03378 [Sporolactobacillus nakayamae]
MAKTISKETILKRINQFIDGEGYRKDYLADLLGKQPQTIYKQLSGKYQNVEQFAVDLAKVLNKRNTFFIEENFSYQPEIDDEQSVMYSLGSISQEGKKELGLIFTLCELIDIYDHKPYVDRLEE